MSTRDAAAALLRKVAAQKGSAPPQPVLPTASGSSAKLVLAAGAALVGSASIYLLYLLLQEPSPPQERLAALVETLARKALSDHASLTAADLATVVKLLEQPVTLPAAELRALYRCVCSFERWLVPTVRLADGATRVHSFVADTPTHTGVVFVLCSTEDRLAMVRRHHEGTPKAPLTQGSTATGVHAACAFKGSDLCLSESLASAQVSFLSLDPDPTRQPPRLTLLPASSTALAEAAAAVRVESQLELALDLAAGLPIGGRAARALAGYTGMYCFALPGGPASLDLGQLLSFALPHVGGGKGAASGHGASVLLYTSIDLLERAMPALQRAGAPVGSEGAAHTPRRVSMAAVCEMLRSPHAEMRGLHINALVPRLSPRYAVEALPTTSLPALFQRAGVLPPPLAGGLSTAQQIQQLEARDAPIVPLPPPMVHAAGGTPGQGGAPEAGTLV